MVNSVKNFSKAVCALSLSVFILFTAGCKADVTSTNGTAVGESAASSENTEITLDAAKQIALADAGVSESDATIVEAKTDYENRQQVYDIKFYTSDAEYEYEIYTSDGSVCKKDVEYYRSQNDAQQTDGSQIDLERAKEIAIDHAGANADSVTFKEAKSDYDDGVSVYEIEFYFSGREYEYKIRCSDGKILEYDID